MQDTKVHFKLYKAGKKWLVAAIGVTALGVELAQAQLVNADTTQANDSSDNSTGQTTPAATSTTNKSVTLTTPTATGETPDQSGTGESKSVSTTDTETTNTKSTTSVNNNDTGNIQKSNGSSQQETSTTQKAVASVENADVSADDSTTSTATVITTKPTTPAITDKPDTVKKENTHAIDATAQLSATNSQGTATSASTDYKPTNSNATAIIDADATDLNVIFTIDNVSDATQNNFQAILKLPANSWSDSASSHTVFAGSAATFTNLPTNLTFTYNIGNKTYTQNEIETATDLNWEDLRTVTVKGSLASQESHTFTLPLKALFKNIYQVKNVESIGIDNWFTDVSTGEIKFRYAQPVATQGQYLAVTVVHEATATEPAEYQQVPADIQNLMPSVETGQVTYTNLYDNNQQPADQYLYSGGSVKVNLGKTGIAQIVEQYGYSYLLSGGSPVNNYTYQIDGATPTIDSNGVSDQPVAPNIYIKLRKVITAKDSTVQAGTNWAADNNFVSAINDQDQPISIDAVKTTLEDPNRILQNGQVVKNGSFKVTYTVKVGNYEDVSDTATITVTGGHPVNFVDETGKTVKTVTLFEQNGTTQDVTSQLPSGYSLAAGQAKMLELTGDGTTPLTINVTDTYNVNFMNNGQVVGTGELLGSNGLSQDVTSQLPEHYGLAAGQNKLITLDGDPSTPVIVNVAGLYTVNFVNNGKTITSVSLSDDNGKTQDISDQVPAHYQLASNQDKTVTLNGDPGTATSVYLTAVYTVNFVNNSAAKQVGTTTLTDEAGVTQSVSDLVPTGYQLASNQASTVTLNGDPNQAMTVAVSPAPTTYVVNFINANGETVDTTTVTGTNGQTADISTQIPTGYTLVDGEPATLTLIANPTGPLEVQVTNSNALGNAGTKIPAITNDPNGVYVAPTNAVDATIQVTATNAQGTSISQSSNYTNNGAIIDADATDIAGVYRISNSTDQTQTGLQTIFLLPKYSENADSTSSISVADSINESTFTKDLPAGLRIDYAVNNGEFLSYSDLIKKYPNFRWSDLREFEVLGQLAPDESYTWTVPFTVNKADYYKLSGVESTGYIAFGGPTAGSKSLPFRLAKNENVNMTGQYEAVTALNNQLNKDYQQVPQDIQDLMPDVQPGDVQYYNFYNTSGKSSTNIFSGGITAVDLAKTGIADLVRDKGYTLLLNQDDTDQQYYTYQNPGTPQTVNVISNGSTGSKATTYAPVIYITLRKVVTTQDSTLKVGDSWADLDNLVSVKANNQGQDQGSTTLNADELAKAVTVKVTDANGDSSSFAQDGKVTKTGTYTVTYIDDRLGDGSDLVSNTATVTITGDYTVNFVDPADPTTVIKTMTINDGTANETEDVTAEIPTDYHLATGQSGTVSLSNDPSTPIVVNVAPDEKTYTINYVDPDGNVLKTTNVTGAKGDTEDVSADVPADYSLAADQDATVTLNGDATTPIDVQVAKTEKTYTINYVDPDGNVLKTTNVTGAKGDTEDVSADVPADYSLADGQDVTVTLNGDATTPIDVQVAKTEKTYTINYVDSDGNVLKTTDVTGAKGDTEDVSADVPADYSLADGQAETVTLNGDNTTAIDVQVAKTEKTYVVYYADPQGVILTSVNVTGTKGAQKDISANVPTGYQLAKGQSTTITLSGDATMPVKVLVDKTAPATQTYTVNYTNQQGQVVGTATVKGLAGATVDVSANVPNSYALANGVTGQVTLPTDPTAPISVEVAKIVTNGQGATVDPGTSTKPTKPMTGQTGAQHGQATTGAESDQVTTTQSVNGHQDKSATTANAAATLTTPTTKSASKTATASANTLPQTDERADQAAAALGASALLGALGLAGISKRKRQEH